METKHPVHMLTDTLFSPRDTTLLREWRIFDERDPMCYIPDASQGYTRVEIHVLADTAGHACDYICRTRWVSRHRLTAELVVEKETEEA
jgi:hypothetical protein